MPPHPQKNKLPKSPEQFYELTEICEAALKARKNFAYKDLCKLAEHAGFEHRKTKKARDGTSHEIYKHPSFQLENRDLMSFQPSWEDSSKAKPYQVNQLVKFIREARPKGEKHEKKQRP